MKTSKMLSPTKPTTTAGIYHDYCIGGNFCRMNFQEFHRQNLLCKIHNIASVMHAMDIIRILCMCSVAYRCHKKHNKPVFKLFAKILSLENYCLYGTSAQEQSSHHCTKQLGHDALFPHPSWYMK